MVTASQQVPSLDLFCQACLPGVAFLPVWDTIIFVFTSSSSMMESMGRLPVIFIWLATLGNSASAQSGLPLGNSSGPAFGGAGVRAPIAPPTFGASKGDEILRHRGPTGKPCLMVTGSARPHTVNRNLYDHVVTVTNSCAQRIALRICYYNSQDCIPIEIPGGERKEAVLGTLPSTRDFRFEYREKF